MKSNSGKPIEAKVIGRPVGLPNIKKPDSGGPGFDPLQNEQIRPPQEASKPSLPKNETPSRFWAFVEPYCKDVTESDVKVNNTKITLMKCWWNFHVNYVSSFILTFILATRGSDENA